VTSQLIVGLAFKILLDGCFALKNEDDWNLLVGDGVDFGLTSVRESKHLVNYVHPLNRLDDKVDKVCDQTVELSVV